MPLDIRVLDIRVFVLNGECAFIVAGSTSEGFGKKNFTNVFDASWNQISVPRRRKIAPVTPQRPDGLTVIVDAA
jgi:hypothetical protein